VKELCSQLQQALTNNPQLEQKLKVEHQDGIMQKQKELSDVRQEVAATNQQLEGCRNVINYLHAVLLGRCSYGFVAWKTKKNPMHEHKLAKIIYEMEAMIN
jgi:hypothetical protein